MKKLNSIDALQESILLLELKQANEKRLLKEQFKTTCDSFRPINLMKNGLNNLADPSDVDNDIVGTSLSLIAGYLSRKIVFGSSKDGYKKVFGNLVQAGVTNFISNNSENIKNYVMRLLANVLRKK
ncbi:MAG: hypothetical protein PHE33_04250 [Bacteroidales bacterium]|nr:hypothetical protein [Bacteroidales bacterium]